MIYRLTCFNLQSFIVYQTVYMLSPINEAAGAKKKLSYKNVQDAYLMRSEGSRMLRLTGFDVPLRPRSRIWMYL